MLEEAGNRALGLQERIGDEGIACAVFTDGSSMSCLAGL